jgi:hypothetical protein
MREAITKLPEAGETYNESRRPFGTPAKSSGKAGVLISMMAESGSINSGRKAIPMAELGKLLLNRFT